MSAEYVSPFHPVDGTANFASLRLRLLVLIDSKIKLILLIDDHYTFVLYYMDGAHDRFSHKIQKDFPTFSFAALRPPIYMDSSRGRFSQEFWKDFEIIFSI
jgi:hypothetical protein